MTAAWRKETDAHHALHGIECWDLSPSTRRTAMAYCFGVGNPCSTQLCDYLQQFSLRQEPQLRQHLRRVHVPDERVSVAVVFRGLLFKDSENVDGLMGVTLHNFGNVIA